MLDRSKNFYPFNLRFRMVEEISRCLVLEFAQNGCVFFAALFGNNVPNLYECQLPARNFDRSIWKKNAACWFMKPAWRRFSNELLACGHWWRFSIRVLTAQFDEHATVSICPVIRRFGPAQAWLIQGNIRGCILNTHPRAVEAHAWIRRNMRGEGFGRKEKFERRVSTRLRFILRVSSRGSIVPFFPPILFLFIWNAVTPFKEPPIPFPSSRFIGQNSFIARR